VNEPRRIVGNEGNTILLFHLSIDVSE
jgi:hypothetical protein